MTGRESTPSLPVSAVTIERVRGMGRRLAEFYEQNSNAYMTGSVPSAFLDPFNAMCDLALTRVSETPATANQCDGCQRGLPVRSRNFGSEIHYEPDSGLSVMACTKDRYNEEQQAMVENATHAKVAAPSDKPLPTQRTVKRFREVCSTYGGGRMLEKETGEWVSFDDYHQLERELAELRLAYQQMASVSPTRVSAIATQPEIPSELYDGMAVYVALGENSGVSPKNVAAVLDVVVRLIRKRVRGRS